MVFFEYIIRIYNSTTNILEELKKESTIYLHSYLGIDE